MVKVRTAQALNVETAVRAIQLADRLGLVHRCGAVMLHACGSEPVTRSPKAPTSAPEAPGGVDVSIKACLDDETKSCIHVSATP
jgi:hypothetical protein